MAKIIYGVAGEGSGHSMRAREIARYLEKKGHELLIVSYDRGYENLKDDFKVEKITGFGFSYHKNQVQYAKTVIKNALQMNSTTKSLNKVRKLAHDFKPDIMITDFEPITALVSYWRRTPLLSIDNQHRLTDFDMDFPEKYKKGAMAAKTVVNMLVPRARAFFATSFIKLKAKRKNSFLFDPILRSEIFKLKPKYEDYVLVYVSSNFVQLIDVLKQVNQKFVIYGMKNKTGKSGNLLFKKPSQKGFLSDLKNCSGIIATAGFTLMTEALYLKKPYLAVPVAGQFEQIINAVDLEKLGYGKYWEELDQEKIEAFLFNLPVYSKNLINYKRDKNEKIFKAIDNEIKKIAK